MKCEILAPVGGKEQLLAAVRSGADAVYLGTKNFNARRNAENFDDMDLKETVSYCHERGVSVHVTLNTVITDREIPDLVEEVRNIAFAGADAVIVQDLAVAKIVRETVPDLPMHASTQMTVHNLSGALAAKELGFRRVVLSRELSFDEIRYITENCGIETEVFVHGALCMCMSGACYLSSMLGGRSGNRGLCAQPCRLDFGFGGRDHVLSLKDMSYVEYINRLSEAGVVSFKIEGRMKRPEYVAAAVTACRDALAGRKADTATLRAVFSRQGFTDGYFTGKRTSDMFGFRSHDDVTAADKVLKGLATIYKDEKQLVPVDAKLLLRRGENAVLTLSDGERSVTAEGPVCEAAKKEMTEATASRYIEKTGGTPFHIRKFSLESYGSPFVSGADLNEMRRAAAAELIEERSERAPYAVGSPDIPAAQMHRAGGKQEIWARVLCFSQTEKLGGADRLIVPVSELMSHRDAVSSFRGKIIGELPPVCFSDTERKMPDVLSSLREAGLDTVIADNIGLFRMARDMGFRVIGGYGLNVVNSVSLAEYGRLGAEAVTVSFELNANRIKRLSGDLPRGYIGYGYLPLMKTRACPLKGPGGCGDCRGKGEIKDRKGITFTYLCSDRRYGTLLNSVPLWMGDRPIENTDFMILYFTVENRDRCAEILEMARKRQEFLDPRTTGLYQRELL